MNESPLITCVIPTYRRPKMLARAIRSVLNQSFNRILVLVCDNASNDQTEELVRHFQLHDPRVLYHCHDKNLGMNANFVYGMSRVRTPFYSLLSDDDVLLPDFYKVAYEGLVKFPEAIMAATQVYCVNEIGRIHSEPLSEWDRHGVFDPPYGAYRVVAISHPTITGVLFKSEFLKSPFAMIDLAVHGSDFEMMLGASLEYSILTIEEPGALFVQHHEDRAKPSDPFSVVGHVQSILNRVLGDDRFPRDVQFAAQAKWLKFVSGYLRGLIIRFCLNGDFKNAEKALDIMVKEFEGKGTAKKLKAFFDFCKSSKNGRRCLKGLHGNICRIRNKWIWSGLRRCEPEYRNLLAL